MLVKAFFVVLIGTVLSTQTNATAIPSGPANTLKEWNFVIFLNGHNNLEPFGVTNINQMEEVGSSADVNVIVQWASNKNEKTQRLLIQKDNDTTKITSPVIEELPRVDMGDWKEAVKFGQWAQEKYPARHTFYVIWNHGSGWHRNNSETGLRNFFKPMDISSDDFTGHIITTAQMGLVSNELARVMGRPLDIMGADACLMAMAEVGNEIASSALMMAASEEVEPGLGWPYDKFLSRWTKAGRISAADITKILNDEYIKLNTSSARRDVVLSSFRLDHTASLNSAVKALSAGILKLGAGDIAKVKLAMAAALPFYYSDYRDAGDFAVELGKAGIGQLSAEIAALKAAVAGYVVDVQSTPGFARAKGVSMWIPTSSYSYSSYSERYKTLKFAVDTGWGDALAMIHKN